MSPRRRRPSAADRAIDSRKGGKLRAPVGFPVKANELSGELHDSALPATTRARRRRVSGRRSARRTGEVAPRSRRPGRRTVLRRGLACRRAETAGVVAASRPLDAPTDLLRGLCDRRWLAGGALLRERDTGAVLGRRGVTAHAFVASSAGPGLPRYPARHSDPGTRDDYARRVPDCPTTGARSGALRLTASRGEATRIERFVCCPLTSTESVTCTIATPMERCTNHVGDSLSPESLPTLAATGKSNLGEGKSLDGLARDVGDQLEVLVEMEHGQSCVLRDRGDEEVRDRGSPMLAPLGKSGKHL